MPDKSMIIIGAGIAGLSTGCYGQMNGYRTQIFELHDKPGGLCTSWKRKGYIIDGCIHWLVGTLTRMASMPFYMTIATIVIVYWIVQALLLNLISGTIVRVIYKEK